MDESTTLIINNLNALYSTAIEQLTAYTFGVVALVGVLIPVIVTLIQWRSLKVEKDGLERYIKEEIEKEKGLIRAELFDQVKKSLEQEEKALSSRLIQKFETLEDALSVANAGSFHLQGNKNLDHKLYQLAIEDFCAATIYYLKGKDEQNGQITLRLVIDNIDKLKKEDFEKFDVGEGLDRLLDFLKEIEQNGRYTTQIRELSRLMKSVKTTSVAATG